MTTARLLVAQDISMTAMMVLPLSLIPTFIVPLLLIFHVICIAQARSWQGVAGYPSRTVNLANDSVTREL